MRKTESREETEWQEITSFLVSHRVWENGTTVFISARHTVTLLITEDEAVSPYQLSELTKAYSSCQTHFLALTQGSPELVPPSSSQHLVPVMHGEAPCVLSLHRERQLLWLELRDLPRTECVALADPSTTLGGRISDHSSSNSVSKKEDKRDIRQ